MRDLKRTSDLADLTYASENLCTRPTRIAAARIDRDRFGIAHRGQLRLRRLKIHKVRDAVLAVEPVGRRHLSGARQRRQGVIRDVRLGERGAESKGAMRGDEQGRLIERLTDRRVRD